MKTFPERVIAYMELKGYEVDRNPRACNIVYIEGCDALGNPNKDEPNGWNDRRMIIQFTNYSNPVIVLNATATCEPGTAPTFSAAAAKRNGVARIEFGQYKAWRLGIHKSSWHPALVQRRPVVVRRDKNKDQIRTGDACDEGVFGINQHGTRANFKGNTVGFYSEGCLVGRDWGKHMVFIDLIKADPRYVSNPDYVFQTAIIPGDDLFKLFPI